jgi:hypothetical protein
MTILLSFCSSRDRLTVSAEIEWLCMREGGAMVRDLYETPLMRPQQRISGSPDSPASHHFTSPPDHIKDHQGFFLPHVRNDSCLHAYGAFYGGPCLARRPRSRATPSPNRVVSDAAGKASRPGPYPLSGYQRARYPAFENLVGGKLQVGHSRPSGSLLPRLALLGSARFALVGKSLSTTPI